MTTDAEEKRVPAARDDNDSLSGPRASVARAIEDLQSFTAAAGSDEMKAVTNAIEWLGMAYSTLRTRGENPAWSS